MLQGDNGNFSFSEFLIEVAFNSAINITVGKFGAIRNPMNRGWFKPKSLKSFFTGAWGKHFIKQTVYATTLYASFKTVGSLKRCRPVSYLETEPPIRIDYRYNTSKLQRRSVKIHQCKITLFNCLT